MAITMWNADLYEFIDGEWVRDMWTQYCDEQYRHMRWSKYPFALIRKRDGVVIAMSVGADVSALKAEAA